MEKFEKFGLSKDILHKLSSLGFHTPTEIQEKAIPLVLSGKDVVAKSATGSGKTLAFGLGMIHNIKKGHGIQALILTPTRELAQQVCQALQQFAGNSSLSAAAVYGGVSYGPQVDAIKRAEIIVGTPGRIL